MLYRCTVISTGLAIVCYLNTLNPKDTKEICVAMNTYRHPALIFQRNDVVKSIFWRAAVIELKLLHDALKLHLNQ